ncbi:MAG TPA: hypothetical protein VIH85_18490 [Solirubrobacteraceae bacterium]
MESNITPQAPPSGAADQSNPQSQSTQITVEVPEDRVAEFHAFFARFLAGPGGRGRHGRHGHGHHGHHGHGCGPRRDRAEQREPGVEQSSPEPTQL